MNAIELSEQEQIRRNSLSALRELGIEPYPAAEFPVSGWSDEIVANFNDDAAERRNHLPTYPRHALSRTP